MTDAQQALSERIKELRRRHFGPRGKTEFARRLAVPAGEYERYERGAIPPGDLMLRMCELTGEDLQWLLTGVASRGTVVIAGTRARHQAFLGRLAKLLDERPELAAALEAFTDLLVRGAAVELDHTGRLPPPAEHDLIPIYAGHELPRRLPQPGGEPDGGFPLRLPEAGQVAGRAICRLAEPASEYDQATFRAVEVVTLAAADGSARQYAHSAEIAACFPGAFGVRLEDDEAMRPMFAQGDAALVAPESGPQIGRPALCRLADAELPRCRIWLGAEGATIALGRLADGQVERVALTSLDWSLEVLYRLAPAA